MSGAIPLLPLYSFMTTTGLDAWLTQSYSHLLYIWLQTHQEGQPHLFGATGLSGTDSRQVTQCILPQDVTSDRSLTFLSSLLARNESEQMT